MKFIVNRQYIVGILLVTYLMAMSSCEFFRDHTTKLGGGYILFSDDFSWIAPADLRNGASIYPDIRQYGFDDDFIVVLQEPRKKDYLNTLAFDLSNRFVSISKQGDTASKVTKGNSPLMSDEELYKLFKNKISINNTAQDINTSLKIVDSLRVANPFLKINFCKQGKLLDYR